MRQSCIRLQADGVGLACGVPRVRRFYFHTDNVAFIVFKYQIDLIPVPAPPVI